MEIYTESRKKIHIQLDMEEIILIKESLDESARKQRVMAQNPRTNAAFVGPAQQNARKMQNLIDKLSIYGYGYQD